MAKVLLIPMQTYDAMNLPIATGLFTSILKKEGHDVRLFDTALYPDINECTGYDYRTNTGQNKPYDADYLESFKSKKQPAKQELSSIISSFAPDVIMISLTEAMYNVTLKILEITAPFNIPTILGGVFPTFAPDLMLSHEGVDMVCVGEGENVIVELCDKLDKERDYSNIPNLYIKHKNGTVTKNNLAPPVDINMLPVPDYSLFELSRFLRPMTGKIYRSIFIETDRGCPYTCTYCSSPSINQLYRDALGEGGRFTRKKRADKIHEELTALTKEHAAEYVYFTTDAFLAVSDKEFDAFIEMYEDIKLPFFMNSRAETVTEPRVARLKDVGLHRMAVGIEHGNEEFRRNVLNRYAKNDVIKKALEIIHNTELPGGVSVNNMIGFPTENRYLAMDTIKFNREIACYVDGINCNIFIAFHGTPLRALAESMGYISSDVIATAYLSSASMLDMPGFTRQEISGINKCFSLYVRFDKSRWPEIQKAEADTPDGNRIFDELMNEYRERFLDHE